MYLHLKCPTHDDSPQPIQNYTFPLQYMACALMIVALTHNIVEGMLDRLLHTDAQDAVLRQLWQGSFETVRTRVGRYTPPQSLRYTCTSCQFLEFNQVLV